MVIVVVLENQKSL